MLEQLGIELVKIDLPFRLNHVNCFMAEGENGWTIIDAGLNNAYTKDKWKEQIHGKEITDLFITHYHPDHFGHAGELQKMTNAEVSMTQIDSEMAFQVWTDEYIGNLYKDYKTAGIPIEMANHMANNTAEFKQLVTPYPTINHYFVEGQKVPIGPYEYEVIVTPGHAEGMVCFYNTEKNVLLSADHILPKITPNISYWFHGDPNPLKSYLSSLKSMKKLDANYVIPSHGKPFYGANDRIDELLAHHEERLEETLDVIVAGSTVYEACNRLFNFKLTVHESRFAIGETLAHLEYLRAAGECQREKRGEEWIYRKI
ncbi:MBL fold metallo-hydrolase [Sporosarcina sp. G11-34]|uniref:MBL fold metallo-hydrolase n=1 Tax=Sporosarcina sp. G11-34 TaxID=2849605 RepID=UPI0022A98B79|nr:MBL fold metallo-hydrolase [Sporosarcina sp. G11-34]MCZ2259515.1 MBL fold metallo-hydrolase [Sporosarcina sp. G11-34]